MEVAGWSFVGRWMERDRVTGWVGRVRKGYFGGRDLGHVVRVDVGLGMLELVLAVDGLFPEGLRMRDRVSGRGWGGGVAIGESGFLSLLLASERRKRVRSAYLADAVRGTHWRRHD